MPYTFTLTTTIPASPEEVYEAWLDSLAHSEMTGGAARMSDQIGAEVSAWDDFISGRNLELVPGERIVQSWRTTEFADEHADSVITVLLQEVGEGTLLTLEHSNVPDEHRSYEETGWQQNYFEPMVAYFTERQRGTAEAPSTAAASKPAPKSAAKTRAVKRTAGAKSKRAAPRAKGSPNKGNSQSRKKTRGTVAASLARKRAKPAKRKSGRGKRLAPSAREGAPLTGTRFCLDRRACGWPAPAAAG